MKKILIMTGEASGDLHGANLAKEIRKQDPSISLFGVGSKKMQEAGVHMLADASEISVVGIAEVLTHFSDIYRVFNQLKNYLKQERPDLLVLIDFPDFNIRLGKAAKKLGIPVVYYISPQVWAWRKGRVKTIADLVKAMIVVFPFEVDIYKNAGLDVRFVGHPLTDVVQSAYTQQEARKSLGLDPARRTLALLPGSRTKELTNLLPDMLAAAGILKKRYPDLQFVLPMAPTLSESFIRTFTDASDVAVKLIDGRVYDVLRASDAAIVTSGTATLETGLMAVPMVIIYRVSTLSYVIGRMLVDVEHIGLVNIVAGHRLVPELVQREATAGNIAGAMTKMLDDPGYYRKLRTGLAGLRTQLGEAGASRRVASLVLEFLKGSA
jgi:lipid-A-disaccharide synthase